MLNLFIQSGFWDTIALKGGSSVVADISSPAPVSSPAWLDGSTCHRVEHHQPSDQQLHVRIAVTADSRSGHQLRDTKCICAPPLLLTALECLV